MVAKSQIRSKGGNSAQKVDTNAIEINVMACSTLSDNIIPTFTTTFSNNPDKQVRLVYDPAAQASFISEEVFSSVKEPDIVNNNVTVRIVGFNEPKVITTKIVKLEANLNGLKRSFEGVVVPKLLSKVIGNFMLIISTASNQGLSFLWQINC